MQAPGAVEELARLQANGMQLEPLLGLLLPAVVRALAVPQRNSAAALLRELVSRLDLRPHARTLTEQLLGVIARAGDEPGPDSLTHLQQTLRFAISTCRLNIQAASQEDTLRRGLVPCCHPCPCGLPRPKVPILRRPFAGH